MTSSRGKFGFLAGDSSGRPHTHPVSMRFVAYIIGFLILIGGLAWAAIEAGAPQLYVYIGSVILLGLGIITGASRTRTRTPEVTVVRDKDLI